MVKERGSNDCEFKIIDPADVLLNDSMICVEGRLNMKNPIMRYDAHVAHSI